MRFQEKRDIKTLLLNTLSAWVLILIPMRLLGTIQPHSWTMKARNQRTELDVSHQAKLRPLSGMAIHAYLLLYGTSCEFSVRDKVALYTQTHRNTLELAMRSRLLY
jgi:hypothetical protein